MELTHFSLFTGIGGIDLSAEWAGFKTVGQCEWADYPTKVLEKHWPDVPKWRDIRSVTAEDFYKRTGLRTVDLISGEFPCQPFSVAGKRKGEDDDRFLWPEMLRVIQELQPTWVIGENVPGIVNMALDQVLSDLESLNYSTQAFLIPACAVDAPHRRNRIFITAYTNSTGRSECKKVRGGSRNIYRQNRETTQETSQRDSINGIRENGSHEYVANTESGKGTINENNRRDGETPTQEIPGNRIGSSGGAWRIEPNVGRVANGIPNRVDRLKCLGNAVVPQQVYPILQAIADIERSIYENKSNSIPTKA
jgi:DNA (cytosine-5)-methyltransferase 1